MSVRPRANTEEAPPSYISTLPGGAFLGAPTGALSPPKMQGVGVAPAEYVPSATLSATSFAMEAAHVNGQPAPQITFDQLNPTEQAAASLGVAPDAIKPIGWLNDAHYDQLRNSNALDPQLARRIEAYKVVSKASVDASMTQAPGIYQLP